MLAKTIAKGTATGGRITETTVRTDDKTTEMVARTIAMTDVTTAGTKNINPK